MAKRTRAAAGAKRPAADKKRTTKKVAAGKTSAPAARVAKQADEAVPPAKGRAAVAAKPATAKAGAKPKATKTKASSKSSATAGLPAAERKSAKTKAAKAPVAKARATATGEPAATARAAKAQPRTAAPKKRAGKPAKVIPPYLAAELGQPVDHEGEPIGAGSRAAFADTELQRYTLQLWQQMQSRRGVNLHLPAMERAGVTIDQIWTTGVTDRLTTSSTADEVRRYRQKLLFRANLLESILTETVSELNRLESVEPAPARSLGESG